MLATFLFFFKLRNSCCHGNQERVKWRGMISIQRLIWSCKKSLQLDRKHFFCFGFFYAPRSEWHAWQVNTQACLTRPRPGRADNLSSLLCAVVNSCRSSPTEILSEEAKLFAWSLLHWRCQYGEVLPRSAHWLFALPAPLSSITHLLSLSFTLSLYPYLCDSLLFAPLNRLSIFSIPLIPSSHFSQMRWSGPGLAIPFLSNPSPSLPPTPSLPPDLHTSWSGTSRWLVSPFSNRLALYPRAVVPPWTHHQPWWPWRREACACTPARSK